MHKGNDLIGKSVVAADTGKIIHKVHDVVIDSPGQQLLALLVDEGGLLASAQIIPFRDVASVGPDAVMVASETVVMAANEHPAVEKVVNADQKIVSLKVMTEDGQDLGTIADLYFDEQTGTIAGYEVSGGLMSDVKTGRSFLPAPKSQKLGRDVMIVPNDTVQLIESQVGGLRGMAQQAGKTVKEKTGQMKDKMYEGSSEARAQAGKAQERFKSRTKDLVDGSKGEFEQGWEEVKQVAGDMWGKAKDKAGKAGVLKEQSVQELEEQRIKHALGRPADRVILDREDNVILERGELITNKVVERARQAGVLDLLLGSVSSEDKLARRS